MIVTFRFFAASKPFAGRDTLKVTLPENSSVSDLVRSLGKQLGSLPDSEGIIFLVNQRAATQETVLAHGDHVLMLRPLAGG